MSAFETITWQNGAVVILDQRLLPNEETYLHLTDSHAVGEAIKTLAVRGAPAIGVAAAMGAALGAQSITASDFPSFQKAFEKICDDLQSTRPTAVNLAWALERMKGFLKTLRDKSLSDIKAALVQESQRIKDEDISNCRAMGKHGQVLFDDGDVILTHCNAGALATAGFGTALGVIYAAAEAGKKVSVFADETRPLLQGARLTAWELSKNGIPVTVITDNMAASMMRAGHIKKIIVGADRIAANGDVANKIGTYSVAINARYHNIPFYVAAPLSTFDISLSGGHQIPIEERHAQEVSHLAERRLAPQASAIRNPAFDVTPAELVSAIVTEKGIVTPPYAQSIQKLFR